jgi:hypothetical protein
LAQPQGSPRAIDVGIMLIDEDELLTAALTIHGVEDRHAAYLTLVNATSTFPEVVNPTLTPAVVLDIATPFITG